LSVIRKAEITNEQNGRFGYSMTIYGRTVLTSLRPKEFRPQLCQFLIKNFAARKLASGNESCVK